jgi:3-oxoacyl-[acyl-carrier protein] reductase
LILNENIAICPSGDPVSNSDFPNSVKNSLFFSAVKYISLTFVSRNLSLNFWDCKNKGFFVTRGLKRLKCDKKSYFMAVIVISGVSRGIGKALAEELLQDEAHVVTGISGNSEPVFERKNISGRYLQYHMPHGAPPDFSGLIHLLQQEGLLVDVLVNNAGMMLHKPWDAVTERDFDRVMRVNVLRPLLLTQALVPLMARPGHVVNVTSMGGIGGTVKFPGLSLYSASKGALTILTEALAEELKETGVHVNGIAPGAVQTEMLEEAFPGYRAPVTPCEMAAFLAHFALHGHKLFNGKVLPAAVTTP